MPFLAPLVPFLPAIGGAIGGLFGGGEGGRGTSKQQDQDIIGALSGNIQQGSQFARDIFPSAQGLLGRAEQGFGPVLNYYSTLLGGDRGAISSLLAPEIESIGDQYQGVLRSGRQLAPRGGGSSAMFTELPFERARDVGSLISGARPQAAAGLASAAGEAGRIGVGAGQVASNLLSGAGAGGSSILRSGLESRAQGFGQGAATGRGIFDILNTIPWGKIFGGGGKSVSSIAGRFPDPLPIPPRPSYPNF